MEYDPEAGIIRNNESYPPASGEVDPVTLEVIWKRLEEITGEVGLFFRRTASSVMINEMSDFSNGLFTNDGKLLSQGEYAPGLLGSMPLFVETILSEYFAPEDFEPGDMVVTNDPYFGGGHFPDIYAATPIFYDDELAGFVVTCGHHIDVGGAGATGFTMHTTDLYAEGLYIPPVKLFKEETVDEELMSMIEANSRMPETIRRDLIAQNSANERGAELYCTLLSEYGPDVVERYIAELLHRSEAMMRESIRDIPDGSYAFRDDFDAFDPPLAFRVEVTIDGDKLTVDWAGTNDQLEGTAINATMNYTFSHTIFALKSIIDPETPQTDGSLTPITMKAPPGSIVNPKRPVPVGGRSILVKRFTSTINGAIAKAAPEKVTASGSQEVMHTLKFTDPETGAQKVTLDLIYGGAGATPERDGNPAVGAIANTKNLPVEVLEIEYPLTLRQYQLVPDSSGAGRYRGGTGTIREFEFPEGGELQCLHDHFRTGPYGLEGGGRGVAGSAVLNPGTDDERTLDPTETVVLEPGDVLRVYTPGGGGYGEPERRTREAIEADIEAGLVTLAHANEAYDYDTESDTAAVETVD